MPVLMGSRATPWYLSGGVPAANCIAAWPLNEASGTTAIDATGHGYNGTYIGATLGVAGIGDGNTAISLSGAAGERGVNIYSAGLAAAFNSAEGSISGFFKVSDIADWSDGTERFIVRLETDANNFVYYSKKTTGPKLWWGYDAGGTYDAVDGLYHNPTGWVHIAITWSKSADQLKCYLNGVQQGTTQATLGTWSGNLASTKTMIGSARSDANTSQFKGSLARFSLYNAALTQAQIQALAYTYWNGFEGLLIDFDDQYSSIWEPYQYMLARGLMGTVYVCTDNVDNGANYLTHENLVTMEGTGWIMGNHTRDHTVLTTLNQADQEAEMDDARDALIGWGLNATNATYLAYPSGGWDANTWLAMAAQGMITGRTASQGTPRCDDPPVTYPNYLSIHWTAAAAATVSQAQAAINTCRTHGKWGRIMFHAFVASGPGGNQWTYAQFYELIDWIVAQGIPVKTIADYYAAR